MGLWRHKGFDSDEAAAMVAKRGVGGRERERQHATWDLSKNMQQGHLVIHRANLTSLELE